MRRLGFYGQYRRIIADNAPTEEFVEGLADKVLSESACGSNDFTAGKDAIGSLVPNSNFRPYDAAD